jgi:hypothetical protein
VGAALCRLGCEIGAALIRLCGYIAAIAMLGVVATQFLDSPAVNAAVEPAARSGWTTVERPYRAFTPSGDQHEEPERPKLRPSVATR